jgi:3,4-dihydroxy-9,10-secoandrosta-1,3,5(10)-triene-9,17-dione 4,5-dioxygenase
MRIQSLGYIGIFATDLDQWVVFGEEILGLRATSETEGSHLRFAMDEREWRLAIHKRSEPGLAYIGWEVANEREWDAAVSELDKAGTGVEVASNEDAQARSVYQLAHFVGPDGHRHEVFCGANVVKGTPLSPTGTRFVTGNLGMGHIVMTVPPGTVEAAHHFYSEIMGFEVSEHISAGEVKGALYHTSASDLTRHHTFGVLGIGDRASCHHFLLQVDEIDEVGRCWDRVRRAEVPLVMTLGRHANDQMFSFYMVTPSGLGVEVGAGGRLIEPERWSSATLTGSGADADIWGHQLMLS